MQNFIYFANTSTCACVAVCECVRHMLTFSFPTQKLRGVLWTVNGTSWAHSIAPENFHVHCYSCRACARRLTLQDVFKQTLLVGRRWLDFQSSKQSLPQTWFHSVAHRASSQDIPRRGEGSQGGDTLRLARHCQIPPLRSHADFHFHQQYILFWPQ